VAWKRKTFSSTVEGVDRFRRPPDRGDGGARDDRWILSPVQSVMILTGRGGKNSMTRYRRPWLDRQDRQLVRGA
jgi:hypothetical protein